MKSLGIHALVVIALALGPAACAATPPHTTLNYGDQAHTAYDLAMEQFTSNSLDDAAEAFRRIRREFGLSRWAWLSELRLADIEFKQDKFAESIQSFRTWIRYHPTQPEVAYARYMIARCYFAQIPSDWLLVPNSWERDQSSTHDAEDALQRYVQDFPHGEYTTEARDYLRRTRELLARHEIAIADFYLGRSRSEAAIMRLQYVLDNYPGSGLEPEALLRMGEVYLLMGRRGDAHAAFSAIVTRFQNSAFVEAAHRYLAFIGPAPAAASGPASGAGSVAPSPAAAPAGSGS